MVKFLPCLLFIACTDLTQPTKPNVPGSGVILMSTTDFSTGFLSAIDPQNLKVYRDIAPIFNDSIIRYETQGSAFAIQRLGSDSLRKFNTTAGYSTEYEKTLGAKLNPHDLVFLPGNLMAVSYYNKNAIDILRRDSAAQSASIDLSSYADADGYAEIGSLLYHNGFIYAAVARLNRLATDSIWPPVGQSYLLKIDAVTYAIEAKVLPYVNPISRLRYNVARNSIIFATPARFASSYALDGACLEFSVSSGSFLSPLITEVELGYEIADCQLQADGGGVFAGYDANLTSIFGSFNIETRTLTRVAASLNKNVGGYFANFLLHSNGKIYLADRNITSPGIRVFSGPTLTEQTSKAIYTGLPPFSLEEVP